MIKSTYFEVVNASKFFRTIFAHERLFIGMYFYMISELLLSRQYFVTYFTLGVVFTVMEPEMSLQN